MNAIKDRILIVESHPEISEFLAEQALANPNFHIFRVADASSAINKAKQINPDLIIANLNLPGLSGKDLLVALTSHGITPPIIMLAEEGQESEIIQAFRLGAADYITWPARETEIVLVVERLLDQVHLNREHKYLVNQLTLSNKQLQQRVKELTAAFSVGKIINSIHDTHSLFEKSLQIAAQISHSDLGWFLLRQEEKGRNFLLAAQHNLPDVFSKKINSIWDDGISSLASISGETLNISGDPLKRFKVKVFGKSIIILPIKFQHLTIALLVLMRKGDKAYSKSEQRLLESICESIAVAYVNTKLFNSYEIRSKSLSKLTSYTQTNEKIILELLNKTENHVLEFSKNIQKNWEIIKEKIDYQTDLNLNEAVTNLEYNIHNTRDLIDVLSEDPFLYNTKPKRGFELNSILLHLEENFSPIVKNHRITLELDKTADPIVVNADQHQIYSVLQGIITNAIQFCDHEGTIKIKISPDTDSLVKVTISNSDNIIEATKLLDDPKTLGSKKQEKKRFGCIGISFQLIQELVKQNNSKVWVEKNSNDGTKFHLLLPTLK